MADSGTVIVGAGQAGYQAAAQLRLKGYTAPITLIGDEPHLPYQQPPLAKAYLQGELAGDRLPFRPEAFYPDKDIELRLGEAVTAIDTAVSSKRARQMVPDVRRTPSKALRASSSAKAS